MAKIIVSLCHQKMKASSSCEPLREGMQGERTVVPSRATSPKQLSDGKASGDCCARTVASPGRLRHEGVEVRHPAPSSWAP